jgi:hypothetical protein
VPESSAQHRPLHPLAWAGIVGGGLIGLATVAIMSVQLAVLKDSREHIRSQDAKVTALYDGARGALRDAAPAVDRVRPLARQARTLLGALNGSRAELGDAATAIPPLLRATQALADAGLPLVADTRALLGHLAASDVIDKAARAADLMPEVIGIQQRLLRVQLATLGTQRASLRTQLTTLEIQRQALTHIENIDRKTGGQVPPVVKP